MLSLTNEKMTRIGLNIVMIIFLVMGCKKQQRPDDVLSREEYASFLVEVFLAEGKLNSLGIPVDSAMKLYLPFEVALQQQRGLTDSVLVRTKEYYLAHPNEMEQVYAAVVDTLNLREQRALRGNENK